MSFSRRVLCAARAVWAAMFALTAFAVVAGGGSAHADYMAAVLADNPVGYWRLNETHAGGSGVIHNYASGVPVAETGAGSGYFDFGTTAGVSNIGDPGPRPPAFLGFETDNYAPWFDAGAANRVQIDNESKYQITGALTLEAWVNPAFTTGTGTIVALFHSGSNERAYMWQVRDNNIQKLWISDSGDPGPGFDSTSTVPADEWTHLAVVFEPGEFVQFYMNGLLDGEVTSGVPNDIHPSTSPLHIGNHSGTASRWDGGMDEVAIYNTALSGERIMAHYQMGLIPEPSSLTLLGLAGIALLLRRRR